MSLVEGLGDEVVYLLVVLFIVLLISLAWISTQVHDLPHISVVVLDRPVFQALLRLLRNSRRNFLLHVSIRPDGVTTAAVEGDSQSAAVVQSLDRVQLEGADNTTATLAEEPSTCNSSNPTAGSVSNHSPQDNVICNANESVENVAVHNASCDSSVAKEQNIQESSDVITAIPDRNSDNLQSQLIATSNESPLDSGNVTSVHISSSSLKEPVSKHSRTSLSVDEPVASNESNINTATSETEGSIPEGNVRIKLKYLDERQRFVFTSLEETIGNFKRKHFRDELAGNMTVRFIYNGQELKHDLATLRSCGIQNESVIHCLLSAARQSATARGVGESEANAANIGALMLPMFAVILVLLWYCRFMYRGYFNAMSTLILVGMTMLFTMGVLSAFHRRPEHEHTA